MVRRRAIATTPMPTDPLGRLRLLQLASPTLPIGAFTYSQGLEWAVEVGWVRDLESLKDWLGGLMDDSLALLELPILARLYRAVEDRDPRRLRHWGERLHASRETRELRLEERNRARALTTLLIDLGIAQAADWRAEMTLCQASPHALASVHWGIALEDSALGYAWSWLENQVAAAIKLIPLGQTDGQRAQLQLADALPALVDEALALADSDIGAGAPALAIASAQHES